MPCPRPRLLLLLLCLRKQRGDASSGGYGTLRSAAQSRHACPLALPPLLPPLPPPAMEAAIEAQKELLQLVQVCVSAPPTKRPTFGAVGRRLRAIDRSASNAMKGAYKRSESMTARSDSMSSMPSVRAGSTSGGAPSEAGEPLTARGVATPR